MQWYEDEVFALEQTQELAQPRPGATVFYGSSSLRLWETLDQDLAPWPVTNRAFGGSTMAACVHFFDRLVPPARPGSLICYAGDNDLGDGRPAHEVAASFATLVDLVDQRLGPIPLGYMAIKPSPARWHLRAAIQEVNEAARRRLAERALSYYIDVYGPMLGRDGRPIRRLFADDGLHLSRDGYDLWTTVLRAYQNPLLEHDS